MKNNRELFVSTLVFVLLTVFWGCGDRGSSKSEIKNVISPSEVVAKLSQMKNETLNAYAIFIENEQDKEKVKEASEKYAELQMKQNVFLDNMIQDVTSNKRIGIKKRRDYKKQIETLNQNTSDFLAFTNKSRSIGIVVTLVAEGIIAYIAHDDVSGAEYAKAQAQQLENLKLPSLFELKNQN